MKVKILSLLFAGMALTTSCEDFLDRPPMDTITDTPDFWENEENSLIRVLVLIVCE